MLGEHDFELSVLMRAEVGRNVGDVLAIKNDARWPPPRTRCDRVAASQHSQAEGVSQYKLSRRRAVCDGAVQRRHSIECKNSLYHDMRRPLRLRIVAVHSKRARDGRVAADFDRDVRDVRNTDRDDLETDDG